MSPSSTRHLAKVREKINRFLKKHEELLLSEQNLKRAIDLYSTWFYSPNRKTKMFAEKVLFYLLERLFWSKFQDSHYVCTFLEFFYETEDHLSDIVFARPSMCPSLTNVEPHALLEYFANHAYATKLTIGEYRLLQLKVLYSQHFSWLTNNFIYMAASNVNPKLLGQILKYGTMFSFCDSHEETCVLACITYIFTAIIEGLLDTYPEFFSRDNLSLEQEHHQKFLLCFKLILIDIPNWTLTLNKLDATAIRRILFCNFENYFTRPVELKHICRLFIRRRLNRNWLLPKGIYSLPLPNSLQQYLDLCFE